MFSGKTVCQNVQNDTLFLINKTNFDTTVTSIIINRDSTVFHSISSNQLNNKKGMEIYYYPDGKISSISHFAGYCQIGEIFEFHKNGKLQSYFDYGYTNNDTLLKELVYHCITDNGLRIFDSTLYPVYSLMNGVKYYFNENGELEYGVEYKNNAKTGYIYYFDHHGNLINSIYKKPECECGIFITGKQRSINSNKYLRE
jgi:antitoxin component YwqK of YwqJK toxin-antitoxin module